MFAQVIDTVTPIGRVPELERLIRLEVVPALRGEPGFAGALGLVDRATGASRLFVFWETEDEAARPLVPGDSPFLAALAAVARLAGEPLRLPAVWEVRARS